MILKRDFLRSFVILGTIIQHYQVLCVIFFPSFFPFFLSPLPVSRSVGIVQKELFHFR
eukprot:TRINITY_DN9708_c0_g1_i1.p2 TRINITY_DN9708_c0_g1~~TRINITY_DN9708_c0_g1_i1.p2  ORF type:complete len:58 (+),score=4.22 TRINITY_DN9708_c0_g1_i1:299-472(+)